MNFDSTLAAKFSPPALPTDRFRSLALATNWVVWGVDANGQLFEHSGHWSEFTGQPSQSLSESWQQHVHPDDLPELRRAWEKARANRESFQTEVRIRAKDAFYRRALLRGVPVLENDAVVEWVGTLSDIEEERRAEEELRQARDQAEKLARSARRQAQHERDNLFQKLVEAQEKERARISRELHDSFGQNLTALLLGLGVLERETKSLAPQNDQTVGLTLKIRALQDLTQRVLAQSSDLARELRPASLDNLGLVAALRLLAGDFERDHNLKTEFQAVGFEDSASRWNHELEITLYRVLQEALLNVSRHARASRVCALLEKRPNSLLLIVEDDGVGFDVETNMNTTRLGLLGMRERLEMVGGALEIESGGNGTTIFARVPIGRKN